jgi:uncharacterized protein (TIGR02217 family)
MGFHSDVFDDDFVGYGSAAGPGHSTAYKADQAGVEAVRFQRYTQARRQYQVRQELDQDAAQRLHEFIMLRRGSAHSFLIRDPFDFTTAADHVSAPAADDVSIGTGTGAKTEFGLRKTYEVGGAYELTRRVRHPVPGSVVVEVNGSPVVEGTDFVVDHQIGRVSFLTAPADTHTVTAGCTFRVQVRFSKSVDALGATAFTEHRNLEYAISLVEEAQAVETGDRNEALSELTQYGGGGIFGTDGPTLLDFRVNGRVVLLEPTAAEDVHLPDIETLFAAGAVVPGGPYFYVHNFGTAAITLKERVSSVWQNIVSEPTISPNGLAKECWVDANGRWRAR